MTLTNRLSLFFLGSLAVVLIGFSLTLYLLARVHLYGQADERLEAAANTLLAATEVVPEGVEWEPEVRTLRLGPLGAAEQFHWLVTDDRGRSVEFSPQPGVEGWLAGLVETHAAVGTHDWQGQTWLVQQRQVRWPAATADPTRRPAPGKHTALTITVAAPLAPVAETLHWLAGVLVALCVVVLAAALAASRAVCRRALKPVAEMAGAARLLGATTLERRLPLDPGGGELADLGRAFNDLLRRLQESFERQRRFTGDASHQLRTPLTAVLGQVEVALRRDRTPEEYRAVLAIVREQADHLRQMVEMLLFLARADAEAVLAQLELLDLSDWLAYHLKSLGSHPRAADFRTETINRPVFVRVHGPLLAEKLVDNLIDNACKYSEPGSAVTLRLTAEAGAVVLAVEDKGQGITAEELPRIFEPFFRAETARRQGIGGVGLGLAVARRIATALGGALEAGSSLGRGSTFRLRLPTESSQASPLPSTPSPERRGGERRETEPSGSPLRSGEGLGEG